jgi:hypothetical protein
MSKLITTLWFEERSIFNEPILDLPIGRTSIRQLLLLLGFGAVDYVLFVAIPISIYPKIIILLSILTVGGTFAFLPIKVVAPEKILVLSISGSKVPRVAPQKEKKQPTFGKSVAAQKEVSMRDVEIFADDPSKLVPKKILGTLSDPVTDRLLPSRAFTVISGGRKIAAGASDRNGEYAFTFIPQGFGKFELLIKPEGYQDPIRKLIVNVGRG